MGKPANIKLLAPNEYLCFQGEESKVIYILKTGTLEILLVEGESMATAEKVEEAGMLVGEINVPNTFIGEIGAILGEPRSASIRASERTEVQIVPVGDAKGFASMVINNRKLALNLCKTIAQRLALTSQNLAKGDGLSLKVREKLIHYCKTYYEVINGIDLIAKAAEAEVESLAAAKANPIYSLGRIIDQYQNVDTGMMAGLCQHFLAHKDLFISQERADDFEAGSSAPRPNEKVFEPNEMVCRQGEPDKFLYLLLEGKLETTVGQRRIEIIEGRGEIFGEMALFGNVKRVSGVRAINKVKAMPVPAAGIEAFLMQKPPLMLHLLRGFAKRLPMTNNALFGALSQMALLVDVLALGNLSCLAAFHNFNEAIKEDSSALEEGYAPHIAKAEEMEKALNVDIEQISKQYQEICDAIGYRRKVYKSEDFLYQDIDESEFDVGKKPEDIDQLECQHLNFVWNVKTERMYACSIDYNHKSLLAKQKIPDTAWKDLVVGRFHNHGENPPSSFISIDMTALGKGERTMEEVKDFLNFACQILPYEICVLNYGKERLPEIIFVSDHIKIEGGEVVDEATMNEILEKFEKDPEDREALGKLNNVYWDIVIATVVKQLPKVKDDIIPFEDDQLKLINFGLMKEEFLDEDSEVLSQIAADAKFSPGEDDPHKYLLMSDFLQIVYKESFGSNKLDELMANREKFLKAVTDAEDNITFLKKGRERLIMGFPTGKNALPLMQKYDEVNRRLNILDRKMRAGGQLTPDERKILMTMKNNLTALGNQLMQYLNTLKGKVEDQKISDFRTMGDDLPKAYDAVSKAQAVLAQKDEEVAAHRKWMKNISTKNKETAYKNEIIRIKKYGQMSAKKAKIEPTAVLYKVKQIATRGAIKECLDGFRQENVDPYIYDPQYNQRVKKAGVPSVLLMPGSGISVYDWEKNAYMVPLQWPKTLAESVAYSLMEYHWDIDEDKSMRESFAKLKIYKKLPFTKMKEALMQDYVKWATKEATGMKVLDKEVRPWFKTMIAHEKVKKEGEGGEG